ncbi:hypothetical protein [Streptomyces sp. MJM8645]|uniref:phage tail tube protein n=1 Tax=Streptomycetaceae TaxID=2062 RepID=UPI0007AF37F0|nr:hypothetical protein [Streptomyces sp. MJM8645]
MSVKSNAAETVVPGRLYLYLAPVGTVAPTDATVALAAGWRSVGHTTEDSLKFKEEPNFESMKSAQSDFAVRQFQTADAVTVEMDLLQWSAANFKAVYGGGKIAEIMPSGGLDKDARHYKFVPPRIGERIEIAALLEVLDGGKHYRFVFPRAMQLEGVANDLQKGSGSKLPLRLGLLGGDDTDAWYMLTDDPAFKES